MFSHPESHIFLITAVLFELYIISLKIVIKDICSYYWFVNTQRKTCVIWEKFYTRIDISNYIINVN